MYINVYKLKYFFSLVLKYFEILKLITFYIKGKLVPFNFALNCI